MNETRVQELIDAYGAREARWPDEERDAAVTLLAQSPVLQAYQLRAAELDEALDRHTVPLSMSVASLLDKLPEPQSAAKTSLDEKGGLESVLAWLFPQGWGRLWQPALAASLPIAAGLYMGSAGLMMPDTTDWSESERYLFAPYAAQQETEQ
jgi:hypothetical protein